MYKKLVIFLSGLSLVACVPESVTLHQQYRIPGLAGNAVENAVIKGVQSPCVFQIESIEDKRDNKEGVGSTIYRTKIHAEDIDAWLRNGLQTLSSKNYQIVFGSEHQPNYISVAVELKKLYINSLLTSKSTNLVLGLQLLGTAGGSNDGIILRGGYTSINWSNSEDEINEAFNQAMKKALQKADKFFQSQCLRLSAEI